MDSKMELKKVKSDRKDNKNNLIKYLKDKKYPNEERSNYIKREKRN